MKLTDIITSGANQSNLQNAWNSTQAADDYGKPLPAGEYVARITQGTLKQSKANQTPGYSLTFEVIEPVAFQGRKFWHDCWLTPAAMPQTKRDLGKLGVSSLEQLENPLPKYIRCKCKLALRKEDNGTESNRLRTFEVLGIDVPVPDPYAPSDSDNDTIADSESDSDQPPTEIYTSDEIGF